MKMGRVLALSLAAFLLTTQGAVAQDDDLGELTTKKPVKRQNTAAEDLADASRTGVYIGVGGTFAIELFDSLESNDPTVSNFDSFENGWGFNFRAGHRFHKHASAELEVEKFAGFDGEASEVDGWMIGLNGRGYFLPGRFQPYVLAGAGYADFELTDNTNDPAPPSGTFDGFAMRFGGGLDIYATQTFVVTTDITYVLGVADISDFDLVALSFGIAYRP